MNQVATLVLLLPFTFSSIGAFGATSVAGLLRDKKANEPATQTQLLKPTPTTLSDSGSPTARHIFPVKDERGLLLTCIAPEIETNAETDIFKECTLAPGRTLDDVMHTFVGAFHYVENKHKKERTEWEKDLKEKSGGITAQK